MKTISIFLLLVLLSIASYAQQNAYANVRAIFPKRVAKIYFSPPTKDSIFSLIHQEFDFIGLTKNDTIADLGSEDGYYPALYSIFSDSIAFYLNDINELDFSFFDSLVAACSKIRDGEITNSFQIVIGNDTCTKLPEHRFNKVIVKESFHHFKYKQRMLSDIKKIMKPYAKLIFYEELQDPKGENKDLCPLAMTKEAILVEMEKGGFKLKRESPVVKKRCWMEFEVE